MASYYQRQGILSGAFLGVHSTRWGHGDARRLYVAIFLLGALISTFLSNDATALILTPVVYALVVRLRLPPLPFMFACTFVADTASFVRPVSNPINVLVLESFGGGLGTFLRYLLLPSLFCVGLNVLVFTFLFRRPLRLRYDWAVTAAPVSAHPGSFRYTVIVLGLVALGYVLASALGVALSLVALGGALLLLAGAAGRRGFDWRQVSREISWSIFLFISGMFLVVRGITDLGLTAAFGNALVRLSGAEPLRAILLTTLGTALGANLINNVPMALVMTAALGDLPPACRATRAWST